MHFIANFCLQSDLTAFIMFIMSDRTSVQEKLSTLGSTEKLRDDLIHT